MEPRCRRVQLSRSLSYLSCLEASAFNNSTYFRPALYISIYTYIFRMGEITESEQLVLVKVNYISIIMHRPF